MASERTELLITKPRTSHCWYGIYFDVEAKEQDVVIHALRSGTSSGAAGRKLHCEVWTCDKGSFIGHEEDRSAWHKCGSADAALKLVEYELILDPETVSVAYHDLPLGEAISLKAGQRKGFLIHTDHIAGLVLRGGFGPAAQKNPWDIGSVTDETEHLILRAGQPCSAAAFRVETDSWARGFVGNVVYSLA